MSSAIRAHYLRCLFAQPIHVLDTMPPGSAAGTITANANTLQLGISEKLGVFIEFTSMLLTALIIAFVYSWSLTLVTASSIVFISLVLGVLLPLVLKQQAKHDRAETKANAVASEAFGSIRMVVACGAESRTAKRFNDFVLQAKHHGLIMSPMYAFQFGLVFFALYSAFALAFWFGTKQYADGHIEGIATIIIVLMNVMMMAMSMERISSPLIAIGKAQIAATTFFTVIDAPKPDNGSLKAPEVSATQDIVYKDITFAYPGRPTKKVLDKLNLTIEAGKVTAIVGPSGCGKSTVVGLLERWYNLRDQVVIAKAKEKKKDKTKKKKKKSTADPEQSEEEEEEEQPIDLNVDLGAEPVKLGGSISTAGHELSEIDLKWWRSQIGLVQQEPFLFNDSIHNNVAYGLVGTQWEHEDMEKKRERVREACKEAFADEFVDRLPDGYETQVGDAGAKLSGGQKQRIAIARSIIAQPKILVLDEATSAIDVRGERVVQQALERASQGRTTIVIAHRLSTIKKADRILVMQSGRIVEQGTHEGLLAREGGVYAGLVHAQQLTLEDESTGETVEEEDMGAVLAQEKSAAYSEHEAVEQGANNHNNNNNNKKSRKNRKNNKKKKEEEEEKENKAELRSGIVKLLYEQRGFFPLYTFTFVFALGSAAVTPLLAYLLSQIIVIFDEPKTGEKFRHDSQFWSLMWFVLAIGTGFCYFMLGASSTQVEHRVGAIYRQQYFESILSQRIGYFDQDEHSTGTLTSRALGDPKSFQELLGVQGSMAYIGFFNLLGGILIAFVFSWRLSLVAFFVIMPIGVLAGFQRVRYETQFNKLYEAVFADSSKWASESIGAIRTVASLTLEDTICQRYQDLLDGHVRKGAKKAIFSSLIFAFSDSVSLACQALLFYVGGRWLASGEVGLVAFFIVFMGILNGSEGTGQALSLAPNVSQAMAASARMLAARASRQVDPEASRDQEVEGTEGGVKIELRDVHFRYETRNTWVLKGVNIVVEKGQFAALVGASGSGKTSIVSLLERFYDATKGEILVNGKDITQLNRQKYRGLMSLVSQEPNLFQGSIRENVLLGVDVDAGEVAEAELHAACRAARIHDFVVSLPDGYNTNVGSRGLALSGGQKQRLSLARALVRNPRVLLLDEATSSLDSQSEKLVQEALEHAASGRTTLAVAHRLATIQRADVIYVLGEGRVLEVGSHAELLRKKGVYWHMVRASFFPSFLLSFSRSFLPSLLISFLPSSLPSFFPSSFPFPFSPATKLNERT
jgi:ATP-binding cassette subfamily B (MDR/TAP) protein 1